MNVCKIDGCDKPIKAKALCSKHHQRWYRHGDPMYERASTPAPLKRLKGNRYCSIEGCNRIHAALGFCRKHYLEAKNKRRTGVFNDR